MQKEAEKMTNKRSTIHANATRSGGRDGKGREIKKGRDKLSKPGRPGRMNETTIKRKRKKEIEKDKLKRRERSLVECMLTL